MSRPQNLSSSVSMFIEDSRVAAVANASANPVNPAHFYTISSFSHSPNIREASVSHDNRNISSHNPSHNPNHGSGSHFVTRPTRLEIRKSHQFKSQDGSSSHDINLNFSDPVLSSSPSSSSSSSSSNNQQHVRNFVISGVSHTSSHNNGNTTNSGRHRPREIIHKIRREFDDDKEDGCEGGQNHCQNQNQSDTTFCANTVVVSGGACGGGGSRRVSLSVQPRMPWSISSNNNCNSEVKLFPENCSTGTSASFVVTGLNSNQANSSINSSKCVHVLKASNKVNQTSQREDRDHDHDHRDRNRDRSFTSVNLTLKSPTSGGGSVEGSITQQLNDSNCEYSCSTAISSPGSSSSACASASATASATASASASATSSNNIRRIPGVHCKNSIGNNGSSLTYSSYSNFRDGFESQLQIQIGPHGGTISAVRRRNSGQSPSNPNSSVNCPSKFPGNNPNQNYIDSMQQMTADLLAAQLERKQKLETSLNSERIRLVKLRGEIALLRSKFQRVPDLERLKNKNQVLRLECNVMTKEVDLYDNGTVPLGETREDFYREINPGQDAKALIGLSTGSNNNNTGNISTEMGRWPRGSGRGKPPPRPPPPRILHFNPPQNHHTKTNTDNNNDIQSGYWNCIMCTFTNHPALVQCEQCQMVRCKPSNSPSPGTMPLPQPFYHR